MKRFLAIVLFLFVCMKMQAQVSIITTNARLYLASGVCLDAMGNLYVADGFNHRVRRIERSTGIITTIAGTGSPGYNGDNILATNAKLFVPCEVFADSFGDIYVTDGKNNRVRKITMATGIISTVAGNGGSGNGGDGGSATNAQLSVPVGLCLDNLNNIYIGDYSNNKIRKVDALTGVITTIAGVGTTGYTGGFLGYSGDGGQATNAVFSGVENVFVDNTGNLFICDQWNHAVRKVSATTGIITTIAGNGTSGYSGDNGPATSAKLNQPGGVFVDKENNIFIAEYGNGTVRKIDGNSGVITTVAGTGITGFAGDGGPATNALLRCADVFLDTFGTMYIADYENNRIRMVCNPKLSSPQEVIPSLPVNIYPNPTKNELTIEYNLPAKEDATIQITDITGRLVITKNLSSNHQKEIIGIGGLSPGVYLYRVVQGGNTIAAGRVVKE
jgi:Secretion system C-terminal sorting domain/NHL repeat